MRQEFPSAAKLKVASALEPEVFSDATSQNQGTGYLTDLSQMKLGKIESKRKSCAPTLVGLAITVGASGLLLPQQTNKAVATESTSPEPLVFETPAAIASPDSVANAEVLDWSLDSVSAGSSRVSLSRESLALAPESEFQQPAASPQVPPKTLLSAGQLMAKRQQPELRQPQAAPTTAPLAIEQPHLTPDSGLELTKQALKFENFALDETGSANLGELTAQSEPTPTETGTQVQSLETDETTKPVLAYRLPTQPKASPTKVAIALPTVHDPVEMPSKSGFSAAEPDTMSYQVHQGDTLKEIAQVHGVTLQTLIDLNQLSDPDQIEADRVLIVPKQSQEEGTNPPSLTALNPNTTKPETAAAQTSEVADPLAPVDLPALSYRVNSGDTLNAIARKHGVSVAQLIQVNGLANPNLIQSNQSLKIPQTANTASRVPRLEAPPTTFGVGGSRETPIAVEVATNPTSEIVQSEASSSTANPYVEKLKAEILSLRAKYQKPDGVTAAPIARSQSESAVALVDVPLPERQVNPEFVGISAVSTLEPPQRASQQQTLPPQAPVLGESSRVKPGFKASPQRVALTTPLPDSFAATIQVPGVGQQVSPELPPLSTADPYLPGAANFNGYIWPAKGILTSGYGWRWGRMHRGIDIAAPVGTPVLAAAPGVVVSSGWNSGGYGNLVEIRHADGSLTLYAHNNRVLVQAGQMVDQGQQIAEMGSTGFSTGPHLHFEVHPSGKGAANPIAFLPRLGAGDS